MIPLVTMSLALSTMASAQVPHLIRYQGQAVDSRGVPLEGPYALTFRFYDAETGGAKVWEETQPNVSLTGGQFSVLLGQVTPLAPVEWDEPRWLSVQVGEEHELAPRQRITSVPLAIRAQQAEALVDVSARVRNSASQSIANATQTTLTFDTEDFDTDTIHSTTSNTSRLTATTAGTNWNSAIVEFSGNATGNRELLLRINGATLIAQTDASSVGVSNQSMFIGTHYNLTAGQYVEVLAYQTSGGSISCEADGTTFPSFGMVKVP